MNILIVGGLLGLAIVAVLGAILLGVGEDRTAKAQKASANDTALLPQQSQTQQPKDEIAITPPIPVTPVLAQSTGQLPALKGHELLASLDGQAQEMTSELRTLAQRAGELEQRLNYLSDLLERQQQHQSGVSGQFYMPETDAQTR